MEKSPKFFTIPTCIALIENKIEKMRALIDSFDDVNRVPQWMYEIINDYESTIDDLKIYISL